jgi:HEPN domain-containing protein
MKSTTNEWFLSAKSDLILIQEIRKVDSLTHLSAFHAQQAVEKSFKALIEEFDLGFVKTHSLETLYNLVKRKISVNLDTDMLIILDQLYIDSRYPGEMGLLPNGKPSISEVEEFYKYASLVYDESNKSCQRS